VIHLVRRTADHLRLLGGGTSALVAAAERGPRLVAAVVDDSGIPVTELDPQLLAQAALAMRYRELRAEQTARRRLRQVEEARAAGLTWVVIEESGESGGDPYLPYSRLEIATASGRGLLVSTASDEEYRNVEHRIHRVRLDPRSGDVVDDPIGPGGVSYPDAATRDAAAAQIRGHLGAS
jgi:hypothetical protein